MRQILKREFFFIILFFIRPEVFSANMDFPKSNVLAFVSDTQAPMWIEGLYLRKDNNPEATKMVMLNILQKEPEVLFMLGDVVSLGASEQAWVPIEYFLKKFLSQGIPVYGILGNHELMKRPAKGERIFQQFFPDHKRTGYLEIADSIAILLMNSNASSLTSAEKEYQFEWYNNTLSSLDSNNAVKAIIVTCHHSPFTNSRLVSPNNFVQQDFVPGYIKSRKGKLFLSGHAHIFEYFKYEDKDFLVIGGGGGLSHPLRKRGVHFPDLAPSYKPAFHYLTVERSIDSLHITSHALQKDFSGFEIGFTMSIHY